jgi:hypothetical protein
LQDFGEHGREYISSELGLLFLRTLANATVIETAWGSGPAERERGRKLLALLQGTVMKVRCAARCVRHAEEGTAGSFRQCG